MGRPMISKLLAAAYPVSVYDLHREAADLVVTEGADWRDTPREAAHNCDIVITCLPLPADVFQNMVGENGALAGMSPGSIWIDFSTTDYHNTLNIASQAAEQGIASLEAPVSNLSHMGVDFANVSFFVGGPQEVYDRSVAVLNAMGKICFHVGRIGQGQSVKLLTNLLFYTAAVVIGDAFCLAAEKGIPAEYSWL